MEDEKDFISYIDNLIIIYNIYINKKKKTIKIDDKITYIIKLKKIIYAATQKIVKSE